MKLRLFTDGGSRGNPGPSAYAFILQTVDGRTIRENADFIGKATNNEAEYYGLLAGLDAAKAEGADEIEVTMDSELVVKQMQGLYAVNSPKLIPLHKEARLRFMAFRKPVIVHAPREHPVITKADELLNNELDLRTKPKSSAPSPPISRRQESKSDNAQASERKSIEVIGVSEIGFEAAANNAVQLAARSVRNIRLAKVGEFECKCEGGKIVEYRARMKIFFDAE